MTSDPLTAEEAKSLLNQLGQSYTDVRDRAYLAVLYRCGLRNNECRMLDLGDIRKRNEIWSLRVRFPKGHESGIPAREIGIDLGTRTIIEIWLTYRGMKAGPLFHTSTGKRMDTSHYRRKIKVLAESAGITRRVHPHALRHTFARMLHDEGTSVRLIQKSLGHRDLGTTQIYLESLGDPEVIELTRAREW